MKYIQHRESTQRVELTVAETDIPKLAESQVLVKVQAFGVNRADTLQRQGKYPAPAGESPILGLEVAGEISAAGANVKRWQIGDRVFGLVAGGGYAEYVAVHAEHLMPVPSNLSMQQAAAITEVFVTAYQSLFSLAQLQFGENVLIHAAASGVGLAAIQLCQDRADKIAVTSSSAKKLAICEQLGAEVLINYQRQDFVQACKDQKLFADVIIDFVGGDYLNRNLSVLAQDGRIVYLAMLAGRYADGLDMAKLLGKRASIIGSTLRNRSEAYKSKLIADFSRDCLSKFESGHLVANLDTVYAADNIAEAHRRMQNNDTSGKLVGVWD